MTMRQNQNRLCALLLSGVMLLGQLPVTALAESTPPADGHEGMCVTAPPANGALVKTVTGWMFVDDENNLTGGGLALPGVSMEQQADFDTVESMLPTQISAEIEGEAEPATVDITGWSCDEYTQDANGHWPITGDYTFTAALPEGYACDPLPTVKVTLGGGNLYSNEYDGLTITGGAVTQETDGQIKLTDHNGHYEISGTWSGTLTGMDSSNRNPDRLRQDHREGKIRHYIRRRFDRERHGGGRRGKLRGLLYIRQRLLAGGQRLLYGQPER